MKWKSPIMAYCLTGNHVHLLTKAEPDYILLLRSDIPHTEIERLRYATKTGRPFGKEGFVGDMEKKLERRLLQRPKGRPKKEYN